MGYKLSRGSSWAGASPGPVVALRGRRSRPGRGTDEHDGRRDLSARHGRLRPHAALRRLAEQRARRPAVRHQLRGGGREQHPARRRRVGSVPVRDHRRRALAGNAPHEYGVDLRIWLPGRLLAPPPPVHGPLGSGHRLCNRDRDCAQSRSGCGDERGGVGNRHPRSKWIDYRDIPADVEARHIAEAIRIHTEVAGARPLGFYQGRSSVNTIRLGMEEGGFVYCADSYADDLPYWLEGPRGPQLMVPYTLDSNDMRFATAQGFNTGDQFYAYLKDSFDTLYAEGEVAPKMLSIGLHCRLVGRPGRARCAGAVRRLRLRPRSSLDADPARHRASLDPQTSAAGRVEALAPHAHAVRRAVRRRLRALALGRGGRLGRGPCRRLRHSRGPGEGARCGGRQGVGAGEARADRGPP